MMLQKNLKLLLLCFCLAGMAPTCFAENSVPLEVDSDDRTLAKVVLLAGSPSSKPGQHEYFAGCALMQQWLKEVPGVFPVLAKEGWPKNEKIFEGARTIVCYLDGGGKQPFLTAERWALVQKLIESGAGLVMIHQAVDHVAGQHDQEMLNWLGGVWLKDIGCRGHWDMHLQPAVASHPILQGVGAFAVKGDGWLYNLHFKEGMVPLLSGQVPDTSRTTADAKKHSGRAEVVAWAYERPDKGRSFAFTGCDLHKNWELPNQRKLILNGIVWTAKLPVPQGGVQVRFNSSDLKDNLDRK